MASSSPRRRELILRLGLEVECLDPKVDESYRLPFSPSRTEEVALKKARAVEGRVDKSALILGADTVVVADGRPLGKPRDEEEACRMLRLLRGRWHEVITGLALLLPRPEGREALTAHVVTWVKMRNYGEDEIESYLRTGEPLDKAGAYAIQGYGGLLVEEIRGCYYNVVGLPLPKLCEMLKGVGVDPWPQKGKEGG